jgi:hypothetical protein
VHKWLVTSENSVKAKFAEIVKSEVQLVRIYLPRTPLNKDYLSRGMWGPFFAHGRCPAGPGRSFRRQR